MNKRVSIIILCTFIGVLSIDIKLPLNPEDQHLFYKYQNNVDIPKLRDWYGVCYTDTYYKSLDKEPITRIFYKGIQLYEDITKPEPNRKLTVSYSEYQGRVFIRAFYEHNIFKYEAGFYIVNNHVYNLFKLSMLMSTDDNLINGESPGAFIGTVVFDLDGLNTIDNYKEPEQPKENFIPKEIIRWDINNIYKMKLIRKSD